MSKVAVFRSRWLPGSETFIRGQMAAMRSWSAAPIALSPVHSDIAGDDAFYEWPPGATSSPAQKSEAVKNRKFNHIEQHLRDSGVQVVHAHFGPDGQKILPTARRCGLPLVVTFHGYDASRLLVEESEQAIEYRSRLPELFEEATIMIAVSEYIRSRLLAAGAPPSKVLTVPIGIDIPADTAPSAAASDNRRGILFVGRFVEKKGADQLIDAYAALPRVLRREHPLILVGGGPLEAELQDKARDLRIEAHFPGFLPREHVRRLMQRSACVAVPSVTSPDGDTEGLPTVLLEAAAARTPIVGYAHAGIPEFVADDSVGLLSQEGDRAGFTTDLRRLLANPSLAEDLASTAYGLLRSAFDIDVQTAKLEAIFDNVASAAGGRRR